MQQMLSALDHGRAVGLFRDVNDAFHPQQVRSEILLQGIEQQPQRFARDRLLADKAERGDIAVVQVVMVMIRVVVVVMLMVFVGLLVGGGIEPGTRVGLGVGGIEALGAQEGSGPLPPLPAREG